MSIVKSLYPDPEIPENVAYHQLVLNGISAHGDKTALVNGITGAEYTFNDVRRGATSIASGLSRLGIRKGDVICLCLQNCPEFVLAQFGALSSGATVTTINPIYTAEEIHRQFEHSSTKLVITQASCAAKVKVAAAGWKAIKAIFVIDGTVSGCLPFSELLGDDGSACPSFVYKTKDDLCYLPYSSGTTGLPKGVMLTHHNMVATTCMAFSMTPLDHEVTVPTEQQSLVAVIPFFHIYGLYVLLTKSLLSGSRLITMPKFEPDLYLRLIEKYKCSELLVVPPLVLFMANDPRAKVYDLSSVRAVSSGAAPLSNAINEKCAKRLHLEKQRVVNGYGLTETSGAAASSFVLKNCAIESIGAIIPGSEAKVIDPDSGKLLGPNEDGEVCLKGPHIMKGYLNDPLSTQHCIRDGWFHTGDIGHYNEKGHWFIVDRIKELIKCKGYQVAPAELEHLILRHKDVLDVAVVGIPDEKDGEVPKAYVVLKKDHSSTKDDIKEHVARKVAPFKCLRDVEFTTSIPRNSSGKIMRRLIKKKAAEAHQSRL